MKLTIKDGSGVIETVAGSYPFEKWFVYDGTVRVLAANSYKDALAYVIKCERHEARRLNSEARANARKVA